MTIKVYKKRTHWYYIYHCVEYDLGKIQHLDFLEYLLDSKIFYFKVSTNRSCDYIGSIHHNMFTPQYYLDGYPVSCFMKFNCSTSEYPDIVLPTKPKGVLYIDFKLCIK